MSLLSRILPGRNGHKKRNAFSELLAELDTIVDTGSRQADYDESLKLVERLRTLYRSMESAGYEATPAWLMFCLTVSQPKTPEDLNQRYPDQLRSLKWWLQFYSDDDTRRASLRRIAGEYLRSLDGADRGPRLFSRPWEDPSVTVCLDRLNWILHNGCVWEDYRETLSIVFTLKDKQYVPSYAVSPESEKPVALVISLVSGERYDPEDVISALLLGYGDTIFWWLECFSDGVDGPERARELAKQYLLLREMGKECLSSRAAARMPLRDPAGVSRAEEADAAPVLTGPGTKAAGEVEAAKDFMFWVARKDPQDMYLLALMLKMSRETPGTCPPVLVGEVEAGRLGFRTSWREDEGRTYIWLERP